VLTEDKLTLITTYNIPDSTRRASILLTGEVLLVPKPWDNDLRYLLLVHSRRVTMNSSRKFANLTTNLPSLDGDDGSRQNVGQQGEP
jgi:hypothetical protein